MTDTLLTQPHTGALSSGRITDTLGARGTLNPLTAYMYESSTASQTTRGKYMYGYMYPSINEAIHS